MEVVEKSRKVGEHWRLLHSFSCSSFLSCTPFLLYFSIIFFIFIFSSFSIFPLFSLCLLLFLSPALYFSCSFFFLIFLKFFHWLPLFLVFLSFPLARCFFTLSLLLALPSYCSDSLTFSGFIKGIVSRDFEGLQMILMNRIVVPDFPLDVYLFLNFRFHIVF